MFGFNGPSQRWSCCSSCVKAVITLFLSSLNDCDFRIRNEERRLTESETIVLIALVEVLLLFFAEYPVTKVCSRIS